MKTTLTNIADLTGAELNGPDREIELLLTDSRSLTDPAKSLFFALHSPTNDGHRYISELYGRGVRAFVVEEIPEGASGSMPEAGWIKVPDSLRTLQAVGALGRRNAKTVVAITGSRGKTTLKEWLFQIISPTLEVSRSPRSYNSQIGVPLSLWGIRPGSDVALIEAGISKTGEMKALSECIAPDTVVITNVGEAHAQGFASREEKIREKVSLAAAESVKLVIYCADDTEVEAEVMRQCRGKRVVGWHRCELPKEVFGSNFGDKEGNVWERENAGHAIAVARTLGITPVSIY